MTDHVFDRGRWLTRRCALHVHAPTIAYAADFPTPRPKSRKSRRTGCRGPAANEGFLRDNAFLAVIFIADEDDCSMSNSTALLGGDTSLGPLQSFRCTRFGIVCDQGGSTTDAMNQVGTKGGCHPAESSEYLARVSEYVQFLKGPKSDPNKVIVAGIMGTITPSAGLCL
jgi:hypothetical protein